MSGNDQLRGVKAFTSVIFPLPILTSERTLIGSGANPEMGAEEHVLALTDDLIQDALGGCDKISLDPCSRCLLSVCYAFIEHTFSL